MIRINTKAVQYQGGLISCGDVHGPGSPNIRVNGIPIATLGQLSLGHAGFPPTPIILVIDNVKANGIPIASFGSIYAEHSSGEETHKIRIATPL